MTTYRDPIRIGKVEIGNRLAVAATALHSADPDGHVSKKNVIRYEELSKGGWGFISVEATYIRDDGIVFRHMQSIKTRTHIQGLGELAYLIHLGGAKCSLQIMHAGRVTNPAYFPRPMSAVAPSEIPTKGITPRALTTQECGELSDQFATAASMAKDAGFDAVTLHGANGFLIQEFMSPATNKRTDRYGDRFAFVTEVIRKCKSALGPDFPLIIRMPADELLGDNGITFEWTKEQTIPKLEEAGIDCFDITAGAVPDSAWAVTPPLYLPKGLYMKYTEAIKQVTKLPVIGVGNINDPHLAESVIAGGKCDIVSFSRQSIADPHFAKKMLDGEYDEIRKCCGCMECSETASGRHGYCKCSSNPELLREDDWKPQKAERPKKVLVVGGGVGGLEAAMVAAQRGHNVTLFEREAELGGTVTRVASAFPRLPTSDLKNLPQWLSHQVRKLGVKVQLNEEVTAKTVKDIAPEVVIMATGSRPAMPNLPGVEKRIVTTVDDYVMGKVRVGNRVAIIGAGHGAEAAVSLAREGKEVTILEESGVEALGVTPYNSVRSGRQIVLRRFINEEGIKFLPKVRIREIQDDGVVFADKEGKKQKITVDTIIVAVYRTPNRELLKILTGKVKELYDIGDCREPRNMRFATHEAAYVGRLI
jgi:2,4-dienoyl-CoA reductase-like NADH-dependent reductase (Old Yellow Enzyme family)/pyruvate/2-oxoglutarate dehydrogenase complex dihydrolipoamide dehydrogenase (E3) component